MEIRKCLAPFLMFYNIIYLPCIPKSYILQSELRAGACAKFKTPHTPHISKPHPLSVNRHQGTRGLCTLDKRTASWTVQELCYEVRYDMANPTCFFPAKLPIHVYFFCHPSGMSRGARDVPTAGPFLPLCIVPVGGRAGPLHSYTFYTRVQRVHPHRRMEVQ